jgi:hypothetical protein
MMAMANLSKAASACCALLLLLAFSSAALAQAGYVHGIAGAVSIQRGSAKATPAKVGDTFESDTVFRTGNDAKVILKFADGQVVVLGVDSALRVGEYRYVARDLRLNTTSIELMRGEMRFVAGLIGAFNREGVRITAGNSMLSIQSAGGVDFTVLVNPDPQEVGAVAIALGEVSVRTPYGPIYRIASGQYVPWQPGRTPPLPLPLAAAPAVIQAAVADLWTTVIPVSAAVTVASAARTAAVVASQAPGAPNVDPRLAGYVDAVSNAVSLQRASGTALTAKAGDTFLAGTTFNTGTDGRVVLKFADGQVVVLGPDSTLAVDQYYFDPSNIKTSSSVVDLANGAMRFVTGAIHAENHGGVSISAGASLVDILNTGFADFTIVVNNGKQQEVGVAAVTAGEISVHTPYGPISKIDPGQAIPWQSGQASPPSAAAAAIVQAGLAALSATAPPDNTPVAVASAARAAMAADAANRAQVAASADPGNTRLQVSAQLAAAQAIAATQVATREAQAVAATIFASMLENLPASAAGPAQAQVLADAAPLSPLPVLVAPTVTPGGGVLGTCTGSPC